MQYQFKRRSVYQEDLDESFHRLRYLITHFDEARGSEAYHADALYCLDNICSVLYPTEHVAVTDMGDSQHRSEPVKIPGATIIPFATEERIEFTTRLLEKTTLYSQLAVLALPVRVSYDQLRGPSDLEALTVLDYNKRYASLVSTGKCVFLPSVLDYSFMEQADYFRFLEAPMVQMPAVVGYTPLNAVGARPGRNVSEDMLVYEQLVLPYFPGASLPAIASIAEKETDSFIKFNHFLAAKISELARADSGNTVSDLLQEIRYGLADLRIEAEKVGKSKLLASVEVGAFVISLGALAFSGNALVEHVAGVAGAVNLLQLIREGASYQKERLDLKKSDFFLPYLLQGAGGER